MALSMSSPPSSSLLPPLLPKQNLAPSLSTPRKAVSCASSSTNSATPNQPPPYTVTTPPLPGLPTTLLNASAPVRWKCVTSGLRTMLPENSSVSTGTPALKTWATTTPSITRRHTTNGRAPTTSMSQPAHWNSQEHLHRKSCEGVLKSHSLPPDRPCIFPNSPPG
eukprot:CCRYP_019262-RC/>CCRYP_019262-RC protein AED:0.50 eAED:0.43 QI:0/-1/0/1/-1/1/1/0/164